MYESSSPTLPRLLEDKTVPLPVELLVRDPVSRLLLRTVVPGGELKRILDCKQESEDWREIKGHNV